MLNFCPLAFAMQGGKAALGFVHHALARAAAARLLQNTAVLNFFRETEKQR